jgi:hypothetical protein
VPAAVQAKKSSPPVRGLLLVQRQGAKEIECAQVAPFIKPAGQNANDFVRLPVDPNHPANNLMGRPEALLPATLTEDDHVVVPRDILSRQEIAAKLWLNAEDWKQICRDAKRSDYLGGLARFRQARIAKGIGADIAIGLHLATKIKIVRSRDAALRVLWSNTIQSLELLAFRIGEWLEQDSIDDAKHCSVSTDAEAKSDNCEQGEPRATKEGAAGQEKAR